MIVTEYVIRSICETIEHDQSVCVTLAAAKHHDDGTIMTYKDHLPSGFTVACTSS